MYLEIGKDYIKKFYNGDVRKAAKRKDGILWNDARIKNAFNCKGGTITDFKEYMNNNKMYSYFIKIN